MATAKKKSKGNGGVVAAEIGAGMLAAAAAGSAAYYFYGAKHAKQHRKDAVKWAHNMKADVIKEAKKVQKLDQKAMAKIVDAAAKSYSEVRNVSPADVRRAAQELKKNWQDIQKELKKVAPKKAVKKAAKKSVKKAPKKAAKKKVAKKR